MKKLIVYVLAIVAIVTPAFAADTPPPLHNDQGTWISEETFIAGQMDPQKELYLLSDRYGWRPSADKVMKKTTGADGKVYYHSSLRIPKNGKFHPAQINGKVVEYLKIEFAHSNWQMEDFVTDPITYINPAK